MSKQGTQGRSPEEGAFEYQPESQEGARLQDLKGDYPSG